VSFVLFRGVWLDQPLRHILPFIDEARQQNYARQSTTVQEIMAAVSDLPESLDSNSYDFDLFKVALKKMGIKIMQTMEDVPETENSIAQPPEKNKRIRKNRKKAKDKLS
jgi:hypothetical protein